MTLRYAVDYDRGVRIEWHPLLGEIHRYDGETTWRDGQGRAIPEGQVPEHFR